MNKTHLAGRSADLKRRSMIAALCAAVLCPGAMAQSSATKYPDKPVRIVVPFATGGTTDTVARLVAPKLAERLGQPVTIENRGGGGTIIGTEMVVRAAPDGHTLLLAVSTLTSNPALYNKIPFDALKDLVPISLVARMPLVPFANPNFPPKNVGELVAYAKKNPGSVSFGSGGTGTMSHMTAELMKERAGIDMTHVPYKGGAPSMADAMAGHIPLTWGTLGQAVGQHKAGQLRALGVSSAKRHPLMPEVPTFQEMGINLVTTEWYGLLAPAGTPKAVVDRLNAEIRAILADPAFGEKHPAYEFVSSSPKELGDFIRAETEQWVPMLKRLGITAQ